MKGQGMLISAFAFALIIAIFAVINVESVQVNFLFTQTTTPLILVILVATFLGGLTVGSFGMIRIFKLQRNVNSLEKQLALLTADADSSGFHSQVADQPGAIAANDMSEVPDESEVSEENDSEQKKT